LTNVGKDIGVAGTDPTAYGPEPVSLILVFYHRYTCLSNGVDFQTDYRGVGQVFWPLLLALGDLIS
jgi:hypothetical protein